MDEQHDSLANELIRRLKYPGTWRCTGDYYCPLSGSDVGNVYTHD